MNRADWWKWLLGIAGFVMTVFIGWYVRDIKEVADLYRQDRQTLFQTGASATIGVASVSERLKTLEDWKKYLDGIEEGKRQAAEDRGRRRGR